jgi:hypothetical protein
VGAEADVETVADSRMVRFRFLFVVLALFFVATAAHAQEPPAQAPGKDVAKKIFDEGVELEKKSDYTGALAKYHEAEQITVTPGLHYHVALCLEMTNKLVAALDAYEVSLKLAHDANKPDVERAVLARLEPLRTRVPYLSLKLAQPNPDAVVQVDGASLAAVLLDGKPFRIDPGSHTITARAPGYATVTKKIEIAASATANVEITLVREAPGAAPVPVPASGAPREEQRGGGVTEPPPEPPKEPSRALPIALGVSAVVLLASGVVFYALAGSAQTDGKNACVTKTSCSDEQTKVRTFDTISLSSFIGGAALGALAIITWTSTSPSRSARTTRVVASPTSVGLEGTF